nr:Scr1 family TA system antitoxin-like transcriptional regulator [Streptomyces sp. CJ_13]
MQEAALPRYERTRHFRIYEPGVIPGLLQTPAYAKALMGRIINFAGTFSRNSPGPSSAGTASRGSRSPSRQTMPLPAASSTRPPRPRPSPYPATAQLRCARGTAVIAAPEAPKPKRGRRPWTKCGRSSTSSRAPSGNGMTNGRYRPSSSVVDDRQAVFGGVAILGRPRGRPPHWP